MTTMISITLSDGLDRSEKANVKEGSTIQNVIDEKKLNGQTFIIQLNGEIAHPSTMLKDHDTLELIGVIYGG